MRVFFTGHNYCCYKSGAKFEFKQRKLVNLIYLAIQASMNSTELENSLPSNSTFVDAGESVDFRNQRTSILPTHEV